MGKIDKPEDGELRRMLEELQFDKAGEIADKLASHYLNLPSETDQRKHAITGATLQVLLMITETLFYRGKTDSPLVTRYLSPYTRSFKNIKRFITETRHIPMRWRLQLGEYVYSRRNLRLATFLADALSEELNEALRKKPGDNAKRYELGEVEYFRLRIALRWANYEEMLKHSLRAIASFTAADNAGVETLRVRWRLGQVLLVFGTGAWRHGDPGRGEPRLHLARWLLKSIPDYLSNANLHHALGAMYRAQGFPMEAKQYLDEAHKQYIRLNHRLNCARIQTSLGIYWLTQKNLNKATDEFDSAMRLAEEVKSYKQQAEIHVWQSWLVLAHRRPCLDEARAHGEEALKALQQNLNTQADVHHVRIDAHLALGNVHSESLHFERAKEHFIKALKIASAQKLRKHQVNAHLSLAELALKCSDTRAAWNHYNEATKRVVPESRFPDSKYLVEKRDRVKKSLGEMNSFHVSYEDFIRDGKTLDEYTERLQSWLVDQADNEVGGRVGKIANRLGIPRQRIGTIRNPKRKRGSRQTVRSAESQTVEATSSGDESISSPNNSRPDTGKFLLD